MHHLSRSIFAGLLLLTSLALLAPVEGYVHRKVENVTPTEVLQPAHWSVKVIGWLKTAAEVASAVETVQFLARTVKKAGKRVLDIWRGKH